MPDSITIKTVIGREIEKYLHDLANLRIEVFREFPYLYDGSFEYEKNYLKTYIRSDQSIAVLILDGDTVVGASTGLPMADETEEFQRPFRENGYHVKTIFYCGESILKKEYRGRGLYRSMFEGREQHAIDLGDFSTICFCAIQRSVDHPLRPEDYQPLDTAWKKFGYRKHPELTTTFRWRDINEEGESDKTMVFWMKELG